MITINLERGFEEVSSWQEILDLPGFTDALDPEQEELKEIIGRYLFREKIACGLSGCRQPHGRGYIVTTKSGKVTNIGNVCGKNHFGVKFDEFSRVFTQALTDHQNRETVASFLFQLESKTAEISGLREAKLGANWVYRTTRALVERNHGCPDILVSEVGKMVRARDGAIRVPRVATEQEVMELEAAAGKSLPRPQYVDEMKGGLRGLDCLFHEYNIREILILDVEPSLAKLSEFDVDSATSNDLKYWAKWCQDLDGKMERVIHAVRAGRTLLTRDNLEQLIVFARDKDDLTRFRNWLMKAV